jgi:hypothetical protein
MLLSVHIDGLAAIGNDDAATNISASTFSGATYSNDGGEFGIRVEIYIGYQGPNLATLCGRLSPILGALRACI